MLDRLDNDLSVAAGSPESTANQSAVHTITVIPLHSDLLAGRPLELDARNGVVVRLGEKHGVPTPAMRMMVALVRAAMA